MVDECVSNPCAANANCVNIPGGFNCSCPTGYSSLMPKGECLDINECANPNACGINAKCINTPGSYKCLCPKGFRGQGEVFCES